MSNILRQFDTCFAPLLGRRKDTFRTAFASLGNLRRPVLIVETGTCRLDDGWESNGQSTWLFDWFVSSAGGQAYSVDLNAEAIALSSQRVSQCTTLVQGDSVRFLRQARFDRPIDLLYLDSLDIDPHDPHPSAKHHLMELTAAMDKLRSGSIVMVDDWMSDDAAKGLYIADFMNAIGAPLLCKDYQIAWRMP